MKKLGKRTLSFMLAAIFALLPIAGTGETEMDTSVQTGEAVQTEAPAQQQEPAAEGKQEQPKAVFSNVFSMDATEDSQELSTQDVQHLVSFETTTAEVGQRVSLQVTSTLAATNNSNPRIYYIDLSKDAMKLVQMYWFNNEDKTETVTTQTGDKYIFKLVDNQISYELTPGHTLSVDIDFFVPNGISSESVSLTATPSVQLGNIGNKEVSGPVTVEWVGTFDWQPVTKTVKEPEAGYLNLTDQGKLNSDVEYEISAKSNNTSSTGEVWTEQVTFTDTLTLPEGVTLPSDCAVVGGRIVDKNNNNNIYFELTNLPGKVTAMSYDEGTRKITFTAEVANTNLPNAELSEVTFNATLYTTKLAIDSTKLEQNVDIDNEVAFLAEPYNSELDEKKSIADVSVPLVICEDGGMIQKTAQTDSTVADPYYSNRPTVAAGDEVTYTITITNESAVNATEDGNLVVDTLPLGMELTEAQEDAIEAMKTEDYECVSVEQKGDVWVITWKVRRIQSKEANPDDKVVITYKASVKSAEGLANTNNLYPSDGHGFTNTAKYNGYKEATATVAYVSPYVDVEKTNDQTNELVKQDETVTYTLTAKETKGVAGKVTLVDRMPGHLVLVATGYDANAAHPQNVTIGGLPATVTKDGEDTVITWNNVDFTAFEKRTLEVKAKVVDVNGVNGNTLTNYFSSDKDRDDSTITVDKDSLTLNKTHGVNAQDAPVTDGQEVTYTLTAKNDKGREIKDVVLTDTLPPYLTLASYGGHDFSEPGVYANVTIGNYTEHTATVTVYSDGKTKIVWNIDTVPENWSAEIIYTATAKLDGITNGTAITNTWEDNFGDKADSTVHASKPELELTKEYSGETPADGFQKGDTVTFTMTTTNKGPGVAENVVMRDVLPNGMWLVDDDDTVYEYNKDATNEYNNVTVGGYTCTVVVNADGTTTVTHTVASIAEGERVTWELEAQIADVSAAYGGILVNRFEAGDYDVEKEVPIDNGKRHNKVIASVGGEAPTDNTNCQITEGCKVTYTLTLTNGTDKEQVFTGVTDYLPQTWGTFSYNDYNGGATVTIDKGFGDGYSANVENDGKGNYTIVWRDGNWQIAKIAVPARQTLTATVTITFPTGEAWTRYVTAMQTNGGGQVSNRFVYEGVEKEVTHFTNETQKLYMQKGVYNLAQRSTKNNNTDYVGDSSSLSQYESQDEEFVIYYFAIVNTGNSPVKITYAQDDLPTGVKFIGLSNKDGIGNPVSEMDTVADHNANGLSTVTLNGKQATVQSVHVKATEVDGGDVRFDFGDGGVELGGHNAIRFGYICAIDVDKTDTSSTNQITLHADGAVQLGQVDKITNNNSNPLDANDGKCVGPTYVTDDDGNTTETTFVSEVTIHKKPDTRLSALYMQKGVHQLANMTVSINNSVTSYFAQRNSLTLKSLYQFENNYAVVEYYFAVVNTGEKAITLTTAVDSLPAGVKFVGMGNNNGYWDISLDSNGNVTGRNHLTKSDPLQYGYQDPNKFLNIDGFEWQIGDWQTLPVVASGLDIGGSVTFTFNGADGFKLQPKKGICFSYVCVVEPDKAVTNEDGTVTTVLTSRKNTIALNAIGDIVPVKADIARNSKDGLIANDGGCTRVGYENGVTTFVSDVTIYPTANEEILPGITKKVTQMYDVQSKQWSAYDETKLGYTDWLEWTITLYNDGIYPMPLETLTDTLGYPYELVTQDGTVVPVGDTVDLVVNPDSTTKRTTPIELSEIVKTENPSDGNTVSETKYTFKLKDVVTLAPGERAVVKLITKPQQGANHQARVYNTAVLKPTSNFSAYSEGDGVTSTTDSTKFEAVKARDSVIIRGPYTTTSYKRIVDVSKPDNAAISTDTRENEENRIVLDGSNREVRYTLSVQNNGQNELSRFGLIDNLPRVGDVGTKTNDKRYSKFPVWMEIEPVLYVYDENGDGVVFGYELEYSTKDRDFVASDYTEDSDEWHSTFNESDVSFRIRLNEPLPVDYRVEVVFTCTVDENAQPGDIAWNSFAYHYDGHTNEAGVATDLFAAPPRVGVAIKATTVDIEFVKKDETLSDLEGAEFQLQIITPGTPDDTFVGSNTAETPYFTTTDKIRFIAKGLGIGTYRLIETKSPNGYMGTGYTWTITVGKDTTGQTVVTDVASENGSPELIPVVGDDYVYQIVNHKPPTLPSTGGMGTAWYTMAGLGLMLLALLGSRRLRVRAAKGGR